MNSYTFRRVSSLFALAVVASTAACLLLFSHMARADISEAYKLGYGDVVSIKVYDEADLSVEA